MPSDGESEDNFDGYITDEDVEDEENPAALQSPAPPLPLAKSELALVQLVLVSYFLAHISLQVIMTLYYTYIIFFNK